MNNSTSVETTNNRFERPDAHFLPDLLHLSPALLGVSNNEPPVIGHLGRTLTVYWNPPCTFESLGTAARS